MICSRCNAPADSGYYCENCRKAYGREHYAKNREVYLSKSKEYKASVRNFVAGLKMSNPCADCRKFYHFCAMDFDHVKEKRWTIAHLAHRGSYAKLMSEINRCELVCANCHRIRTFEAPSSTG